MTTFRIQLRKEWAELWATRKTIIVLAVMVGFGFLSPLTAKLLPDLLKSMGEGQTNVTIAFAEPTLKDAIDQYVKNTTQMILLLAVLMSFGVVVTERERNLMTLMFTHPLPRATFVLAKFVALALLFGLGMALSAGAAYLYTAILFEAPDPGGYLAMAGLLTVYLLAFIAVSVLASALGRTTTIAAALAFGFFVLILLAGVATDLAPDRLAGWGANLANGAPGPARWGALAVTVGIVGLALGAGCFVLNRQEI